MSEKWTKGPWIVDFDLYDEEGPLDVPEVNGRILDQDNRVVCQASTEANVFLIHAAPEMYDALKLMVELHGHTNVMPTERAHRENAAARMAISALKKARGES